MTTNHQRAAEVIYPWIDGNYGDQTESSEAAAQALVDADLITPDIDPTRVHRSGGVTIIETGSDRTVVATWGGMVTIVDEVAGKIAPHAPEEVAENCMTLEEVDGLIAALTHARQIVAARATQEKK